MLSNVPGAAGTSAGFEANDWYGFGATKGTSPEIIQRLKLLGDVLGKIVTGDPLGQRCGENASQRTSRDAFRDMPVSLPGKLGL